MIVKTVVAVFTFALAGLGVAGAPMPVASADPYGPSVCEQLANGGSIYGPFSDPKIGRSSSPLEVEGRVNAEIQQNCPQYLPGQNHNPFGYN